MYGCISVIITSEKGVYTSHIWENPVFENSDFTLTDDSFFVTNSLNALHDSTATAQSILALIGTDATPGVLHSIYKPKIFVHTPFTSDFDRDTLGYTTRGLNYDTRARWLAYEIAQILPGSDEGITLGYKRFGSQQATREGGTAGRAILEVDPIQYYIKSPQSPVGSNGLQVGQWRLWVEDQLIISQDFWLPPHPVPPGGIQKRDIRHSPCARSTSKLPSNGNLTLLSSTSTQSALGKSTQSALPTTLSSSIIPPQASSTRFR